MAKVTKENKQWGKLNIAANGVSFIGEELVNLEIPENEMNPVNHYTVCINGNQIILGVGEKLKVPQSVYDAFTHSQRETAKAKRKMKQVKEVKM